MDEIKRLEDASQLVLVCSIQLQIDQNKYIFLSNNERFIYDIIAVTEKLFFAER